jgi:hypothetical protein
MTIRRYWAASAPDQAGGPYRRGVDFVEGVARIALGVSAVAVVLSTALSAVRTFVLPRGANTALTRFVFVVLRRVFDLRVRRQEAYERQDAVMALFAPLALLVLPVVWLGIVFSAYAAALYAIDPHEGLRSAVETSGSNLFTLGTHESPSFGSHLLGYTEAGLGIALLALLITYLPSIYASFSRREAAVQLLEVRAGSPPSAVVMLRRYTVIGGLDRLDGLWRTWEQWFVEVEESHQSLSALVFLRSPRPDLSWVTAAGCVLDAAALTVSAVEHDGTDADASLCIRAGYLCLRRIGAFFGVQSDPDPSPTDPIAVTRDEFDQALDDLAAAGVPLKPDRDQAWADFAGWRINYDTALLGLAAVVFAPTAPWSSDRSPVFNPRFRRRPS